mmetsp:Transcript_11644/g.29464  ORF Transcript_11644/g.29464 Transcript_11644/m.29464 type:complete len:246 (+) Transcript_11644:70-807(+)
MIVRLVRTLASASASTSLSHAPFRRGFQHSRAQSLPSSCPSTSLSVLSHQTQTRKKNIRLFSSIPERMPEPPYQYLSADAPVLDLSDLSAKLQASDEQRQEAFDRSRKFQKAFVDAQIDLEQNKGNVSEWIQNLQSSLEEAIARETVDTTGRLPRAANLNQRVEDLCRFVGFSHFFADGKDASPVGLSVFGHLDSDGRGISGGGLHGGRPGSVEVCHGQGDSPGFFQRPAGSRFGSQDFRISPAV